MHKISDIGLNSSKLRDSFFLRTRVINITTFWYFLTKMKHCCSMYDVFLYYLWRALIAITLSHKFLNFYLWKFFNEAIIILPAYNWKLCIFPKLISRSSLVSLISKCYFIFLSKCCFIFHLTFPWSSRHSPW